MGTPGRAPRKRPAPDGADRSVQRPAKRPGRPGANDPRAAAQAPKSWGSVARRGANRLNDTDPSLRVGGAGERPSGRPEPFAAERWERVDDDVRSEAGRAARRGAKAAGSGNGRRPPAKSQSAPQDKTSRRPPRQAGPGSAGDLAERELASAIGPTRATRAARQLRDAARAFERERFAEARTLLRPLAEQAPRAPSVRELLGLTYYRLGRWKLAVTELEAFAALTGSTEQHPILADCYRALGRWGRVEELWNELREASPSADLVAEGRIVMAGARADRGDVAGAIKLLEQAKSAPKSPKPHHLRMAYALADLRERSGNIAGARELFHWVADQDRNFADAAERAHALM